MIDYYFVPKKRKIKWISISPLVYLLLFVLSLGFIGISFGYCETGCWWQNLWLNLGAGTFASLIVSLIIDIGNTYRSNLEHEFRYNVLTKDCIYNCHELRKVVRDCKEEMYSNYEALTFESFIDESLIPEYALKEMSEEEYRERLFNVIYSINNLKESVDKLIEIIPICLDENINDKLLHNLRRVSLFCRIVDGEYDKDNYKECIKSIKHLKDIIIDAFPELEDDFTKPYFEIDDDE